MAAKQAALKKPVPTPAPPTKVPQDRVPNGMVRITHNPLTNSAVITPLYGPLEPNPSYLQQPLGLSQPVKLAPPPNPVSVDPPRPNPVSNPKIGSSSMQQQPLTSVSGVANSTSTSSQPQQMVTIRRVMQPNLSEPVVTVTLKGETPANDRVLFTLVNGQVLPTDKSKPSSTAGNSTLSSSQGSNNISPKAAKPPSNPASAQSVKKQKKQEKKKQKRLLLKAASNTASLPQSLQIDQVGV